MTQQNKNPKRITLATASIFAAIAAASATQYVNNNVAVGQIGGPANVPTTANAPQNPFGPANIANAVGAQTTGATIAPMTDPGPELANLRERQMELRKALQKAPTSLAEQQEQQRLYNELTGLQSRIQQLEAAAGQYAVYNQQAADSFAPNLNQPYQPQGASAFSGASNPLTAQRQNRQQLLNESGLNSGSLFARADVGPGITPSEVALLREQKEGLTLQYNQIMQTLRALEPSDAALAENLKQEQASVLAQLRDIETRLSAAPAASINAAQQTIASGFAQQPIPAANQLNMNTQNNGVYSVSTRMQKVNQAATLLREAGLAQLADYATAEVPKLADPNYREVRLVPGNWAESDGLAESRNNPFKQVGAQDIENINGKIDALEKKIDALTEALANMDATLKLLTRNTANAPTVVEPTPVDVAPIPADALPVENANGDEFSATNPAALEALDTDEDFDATGLVPGMQGGALGAPEEEVDPNLPPIPGEEDL